LHPSLHAHRVEGPADDVIAHPRQVFDSAASNQNQRVLLEVVTNAGNVGRHFDPVGQPHASDLAQRRIGFLWRLREHADADATLLRAVLEGRTLGLADDLSAALAHELADGRHKSPRPPAKCDNAANAAAAENRSRPRSRKAWRPKTS